MSGYPFVKGLAQLALPPELPALPVLPVQPPVSPPLMQAPQ